MSDTANIEIYTRALCGYCSAAKALLDRKGIAYTEHDATFDQDLRKEMIQRAEGGTTFPQIFVAGTPLGGFDDINALERAGKLDALLKGA